MPQLEERKQIPPADNASPYPISARAELDAKLGKSPIEAIAPPLGETWHLDEKRLGQYLSLLGAELRILHDALGILADRIDELTSEQK
jgi:hypothetical protein